MSVVLNEFLQGFSQAMNERRMVASTSSDDDESSGAETWIEWFCKQEGNEFFCEVDQRYIGK